MAVWRRENGSWKLFRDQVTNMVNRTHKMTKLDRADHSSDYGVGDFTMQNEYGITIRIAEQNDSLKLSLPGQLDKEYVLYPTHDNTWFIEEESWTFKFSESGDTMYFNSWGVETLAIKNQP